jgi:hypothetical protein
MELSLEVAGFDLFVVSLHALLLQVLGLVHFLVVVLDHLLVGLGIDGRLSERLLASPLLHLYDHLRLLVLASVLPDGLIRLQLLPSPPNGGLLVEDFEVLCL